MENEKKKISKLKLFLIAAFAIAVVGAIAFMFAPKKEEITTLTATATTAPKTTATKATTKSEVKATKKSKNTATQKSKQEKKQTTTKKVASTTKKKNYTTKATTQKFRGISGGEIGTLSGNWRATTKKYTTTTKKKRYDPYNAADYADPEDFYYDNYDDFFDYYDAEDYYYDHCDD